MENEIIQTVIDNLFKTTGIQAIWKKDTNFDGILVFLLNEYEIPFVVEIKTEIRPHQVHQIERYNHEHENFLLIANQIFPRVKEELRQKGIAYLEVNGNIFLKKKNFYLFIDTQKTMNRGKEKSNRAFTKTGLKVLFYLLQHKEHINLTQRELAEKAGVGLGNIPQVIEGLKNAGYLLPLNNKEYIWEERKELFERWIIEYGTVLKPKLRKERYTFKGQWQEINLNNNLTVWGGEPAADLHTNHLRPEKFLIYTHENRMDLIKNYRLIPDNNGEIEVLEMFWQQEEEKTAPTILIYADLILEGGKRNKETAEKIYHEYIQPNI